MSYTSVGRNKVYASIQDLPQNQKLVNGDRILIQTQDGTALVDYENVKIDLAHTTFGTQITNLIQFTSTVESFVDAMQSQFTNIKQETSAMKIEVSQLKQQIECCKVLFKFIMGLVNQKDKKYIELFIDNNLTGAGRSMYEQCMEAILAQHPIFTFRDWNLLSTT